MEWVAGAGRTPPVPAPQVVEEAAEGGPGAT